MTARPSGLTLKELKRQVDKAVKAGLGDKTILISDDEEGNGYHQVWYDLLTDADQVEACIMVAGIRIDNGSPSAFVILGGRIW